MSMFNSAVKNQRQQRRCITVKSFAEPLLIAVTRLILSHRNSVLFCVKEGPQMAQHMTIGTSSFAMMLTVDHSADQRNWNHWLLKRAPHPWCICLNLAIEGGFVLGKVFQLLIKMYHHCKFDWKSLLRWVKWWSYLTLVAVLYIRAVNVYPGLTTLLACCRDPTCEKTSLLVDFFFWSQMVSCLLMRDSLSCGSHTSIRIVPISILKKVWEWDGPSSFSIVSGILSFWQVCWMVVKLLWHVAESAWPMVRKSSR